MPEPDEDAGGTPVPVVLCDTRALTDGQPGQSGALWRLAESGRQLDANLVHLPPHEHVGTHAEPDLDVLLHVVAGSGTLGTGDGTGTGEEPEQLALAPGTLIWLPHGSVRELGAGPDGLSYLTVHTRRPGIRIRNRPPGG